jgi:hypothetical protein
MTAADMRRSGIDLVWLILHFEFAGTEEQGDALLVRNIKTHMSDSLPTSFRDGPSWNFSAWGTWRNPATFLPYDPLWHLSARMVFYLLDNILTCQILPAWIAVV